MLLGWLVQLQGEVDILDGYFDGFGGKSTFGGRMHTLFNDYLDDIGQNVRLIHFSFFVADLQFSPF